MHVVAIHGLTADRESPVAALSAALGMTAYEARSRLRSPGNGPFIVGVFSERERAVQLADRLHTAGFSAILLTADEIAAELSPMIVRKFALNENDLSVITETGESLKSSFQDIDLILRGVGIVSSTTTETVKSRTVSVGRAVLSGGLMLTKTTKKVQEVRTEERQGFFHLYARDNPVLVFRENNLVYDSLGPARQPSRALNFTWLVAELRRRCPGARYDERLLNRPGQVALLGPSLNPEEHLSVATALLAKALRGRTA